MNNKNLNEHFDNVNNLLKKNEYLKLKSILNKNSNKAFINLWDKEINKIFLQLIYIKKIKYHSNNKL